MITDPVVLCRMRSLSTQTTWRWTGSWTFPTVWTRTTARWDTSSGDYSAGQERLDFPLLAVLLNPCFIVSFWNNAFSPIVFLQRETFGFHSSPQPVIYYLVKWCSLPYEDATWELKEDVDEGKVGEFQKIQNRQPRLKRMVS